MKKTIVYVLIISLLLSGCRLKSANTSQSINKSETVTVCTEAPNENGDPTSEKSVSLYAQSDKKLAEQYANLDNPYLLQYVKDSFTANLESQFDSDDYIVQDVNAVYVSKEYLEEISYNSQKNIYFGYTLSELDKQYDGDRYVFTLGEDGTTVVQKAIGYDDTYDQIIKNVAIGTGVILVCVTVSVATGGAGMPAVSTVFAASAKTGTLFALSSGAMSGIVSGIVTGLQTKDPEVALKEAARTGSEAFKWGAIVGVVSGGINGVLTQKKATVATTANSTSIPSWRESENYVLNQYGGMSQVSYIGGKEVPYGTPGSTRPDIVRQINGKLEAIEVKNYDLSNQDNLNKLYKILSKEIPQRGVDLPKGSYQRIVLDVRGRDFLPELVNEVPEQIKKRLMNIYPNIPVDIIK